MTDHDAAIPVAEEHVIVFGHEQRIFTLAGELVDRAIRPEPVSEMAESHGYWMTFRWSAVQKFHERTFAPLVS